MPRKLLSSLTKYIGFGTIASVAFFAVGVFVASSAFTPVQPGTVTNPTFSPTEGNVVISPPSPSSATGNIQGSITSTDLTNANNRHLIFSGFNNETWDVYGGHGHGGFFGIAENNTATSPAFVIQAGSGNVGIGTTNPATKLELGGTDQWSPLRIRSTNATGTGVDLLPGGAFPGYSLWAGAGSYANKLFISRKVSDDHSSELVTVDSSGNVGIGTESPTEKLEVAGKVKATEFCIGADCKNAWPSGGSSTVAPAASQWTTSGTDVYYNAGNVGIGTANPNKQLHVKTASGNAEIDIQSSVSPYWGIYQDDITDQLRFWNKEDRLTLAADGAVGIGVPSPQAKLDIGQGAQGGVGELRIDARLNGSGPGLKILTGTRTGGEPVLEVDNNLGNPDFVILANSNVGIGVPSPQAKLDVSGDIRVGGHIIEAATGWPAGNYCIMKSVKYGPAGFTGACPGGFTETGMITDHQTSGGHTSFDLGFSSGGISDGSYAAQATSAGAASGKYQLKFCCK